MPSREVEIVHEHLGRAVRSAAQLRLLAAHLVHEEAGRCELTNNADGRCSDKAIAARWEYGFCDFVCERHAALAAESGALVVYARHHDGTDGPAPALGEENQASALEGKQP